MAMNRFPVRTDRETASLFEERWASRSSMLPQQPGLLGFSLLRRRCADYAEPFTYSTATLWASEAAWSAWREGAGKSAHAAKGSDQAVRTPVSEWMNGAASPIFWDVPVALHPRRGIAHVCLATASPSATGVQHDAAETAWQAMLAQLAEHKERWGHADAALGKQGQGELGRWCQVQRRLWREQKLAGARVRALNALGFSWTAPSDVDDPRLDWDALLPRLAAYRAEHGDCDVPKKFAPDPALGGWVAAVRRCRAELSAAAIAELDAVGFVWTTARQCGSAFMQSFRELRAFHATHGHTDVASVLGAEHPLARWCSAMRTAVRSETLSPKRMAHLREIGFL